MAVSTAERKGAHFAADGDGQWESTEAGIRRKVLSFNDQVMMVSVVFEAGAVGAMHSHPHVQCGRVQSGLFDLTIAGEKRRLGPGDSFLVPSGALHQTEAIEAGSIIDVFAPMREDFLAPPVASGERA